MPDLDLSAVALPVVVGIFIISGAVVAVAGARLVKVADRLADVTGMGEAFVGAVFLGATTSIADLVVSGASAFQGYPQLAVSNAVGGVAVQTAFLAIADITYRRSNLEHAAASLENMMQAAMLATLLAIPLLALSGPDVTILGVHPATVVMVAGYLFGLHLAREVRATPQWRAKRTDETRQDVPDSEEAHGGKLTAVWIRFGVLAAIVAAAGLGLAESGISISERTGISESVVGAFLTAVATSFGELVTSIAAVKRGALTLAVGGVIGGNTFDLLLVPVSDVAYRSGSVYHAIGTEEVFIIALTTLLTGLLLMGLLRREKAGIVNIGFESFLVLILYFGGFLVLMLT